jgi:hypothetical protein
MLRLLSRGKLRGIKPDFRIKILMGIVPKDGGDIYIDGAKVDPALSNKVHRNNIYIK